MCQIQVIDIRSSSSTVVKYFSRSGVTRNPHCTDILAGHASFSHSVHAVCCCQIRSVFITHYYLRVYCHVRIRDNERTSGEVIGRERGIRSTELYPHAFCKASGRDTYSDLRDVIYTGATRRMVVCLHDCHVHVQVHNIMLQTLACYQYK